MDMALNENRGRWNRGGGNTDSRAGNGCYATRRVAIAFGNQAAQAWSIKAST